MGHFIIKLFEMAILGLVGWYAQRRPKSLFTRLALMKIPFIPSPEPDESELDFLMRYSHWTFMWFIRIAIVYAAAWYLLNGIIGGYTALGILFLLVFPVLTLTLLVRSAIWYIKALLCRNRNIRKVFLSSEGRFVIDENRDTYDKVPSHVV